MDYPNKIFTLEFKGDNPLGGQSHFAIVVAASDKTTAEEHVHSLIGFKASATWLMGAVYPTIYTSNGERPEKVQVKILTNLNFHTNMTKKNT